MQIVSELPGIEQVANLPETDATPSAEVLFSEVYPPEKVNQFSPTTVEVPLWTVIVLKSRQNFLKLTL